jgi:hypothetical protein
MPRAIDAFPDWSQHGARVRDAVADLQPESLALRAGPENAPIWLLAAHVAGTRVFWLCEILGEPGAENTPWPLLSASPSWDDDETHPRTGAELAWALDSSWEITAHAWIAGRWRTWSERFRGPGLTASSSCTAAPRS